MLRFVYAALKGNGGHEYGDGWGDGRGDRWGDGNGGEGEKLKVVLVSWLRDETFWRREGGRGVC